jgi:hypothetical protein
MANELKDRAFKVSVCSALQFYNAPHTDYDVYIFHRPNASRLNFAKTIELIRRSGRTLIADFDDLIFGNADVAVESPAARNSTQEIPSIIRAFASNLEGLRHFQVVTTSTAPLAELVSVHNPNASIFIVPNVVPTWMVQLHTEMGTPWKQRPSSTIGYFAGAHSYKQDLTVVQEVLHRVLLEDPTRQLLIAGPVDVPEGLAALPNVLTCPVVDYLQLPYMMSKCATVIAPLEDNTFNRCTSRVRFLEAALAGCHLAASPIPDIQDLRGKGLSLPETTNDWYDVLSTPLTGDALKVSQQVAIDSLSSQYSIESLLQASRGSS